MAGLIVVLPILRRTTDSDLVEARSGDLLDALGTAFLARLLSGKQEFQRLGLSVLSAVLPKSPRSAKRHDVLELLSILPPTKADVDEVDAFLSILSAAAEASSLGRTKVAESAKVWVPHLVPNVLQVLDRNESATPSPLLSRLLKLMDCVPVTTPATFHQFAQALTELRTLDRIEILGSMQSIMENIRPSEVKTTRADVPLALRGAQYVVQHTRLNLHARLRLFSTLDSALRKFSRQALDPGGWELASLAAQLCTAELSSVFHAALFVERSSEYNIDMIPSVCDVAFKASQP